MSQVVLGCVLYGESKEFDLAATCDVWVWSRSMNVGVVCRVVIVRVWLHMHMGVLLHIETSYVCMWGGGGSDNVFMCVRTWCYSRVICDLFQGDL